MEKNVGVEIREASDKRSPQIRGQVVKQQALLFEWQSEHRVLRFIGVMLAKQSSYGFPAGMGDQIAQLSRQVSDDGRNSLLQVQRAPEEIANLPRGQRLRCMPMVATMPAFGIYALGVMKKTCSNLKFRIVISKGIG